MTLDLVLIALAIALDPLPLTAFILVLTTPGGTRKGFGFLAGWLISIVALVIIALLLTGGKPLKPSSTPSQTALAVRILIGVGLLYVAWSRHRHRGRPRPTPRWMSTVNRIGVLSAAVLAFLLQPWGLVVAGAATVTRADLADAAAVAAIVVFCVLSTSSYLLMQGFAVVSPEATAVRLANLRDWIDRHRDPAIVAISLLIGLWLIGKSSYLLAT